MPLFSVQEWATLGVIETWLLVSVACGWLCSKAVESMLK